MADSDFSGLRAAVDRELAPLRRAFESQEPPMSTEADIVPERLWCTACGTVTRDRVCDCNDYPEGHEMRREPHFVNYADQINSDFMECRKELLEAQAEITKLRAERDAAARDKETLRKAITDYMSGDYEGPHKKRAGGPREKCPHGHHYWEDCSSCIDAHFEGALSLIATDQKGGAT